MDGRMDVWVVIAWVDVLLLRIGHGVAAVVMRRGKLVVLRCVQVPNGDDDVLGNVVEADAVVDLR